MTGDLKKRFYDLVDPEMNQGIWNRSFNIFIMGLIFLNLAAVMMETVKSVYSQYGPVFQAFEAFSLVVFAVEYSIRLWTCTVNEDYREPWTGRVRFALRPLMVLDLVVVVPMFLSVVFDLHWTIFPVLRTFRLFVIFKILRYSHSLQLFWKVVVLKKQELIITFTLTITLLIFASCFIYLLEHEAQPEAFSSIPAAMWWGVATMTTMSYGEIYPITPLGQVFGGFISLLGLGMFGLPTAILATGFIQEMHKEAGQITHCPHCGKALEGE